MARTSGEGSSRRARAHLPDQRRGVVASLPKCRLAAVADGDEDVAHETVAPGALDGGLRECDPKGGIVEPSERREARRVQRLARREGRLGMGARELVPRADGQAVVATIDSVAHGRAQGARDVALVLDGEVGDAAARVDPVGRREGIRRADVEAAAAGAAMVHLGLVGSQIEGGEDLSQEQPGAEFA